MSKYSTSRHGPQPISGRTDKRVTPLERLDSNVVKLCDLHVYKVPADLWRENFNNILNNVVTETISIGIIRVPSETRLSDLRDEIIQQLQPDDMGPRDWVFLRSVGRSLTRLRTKQEYQLKAKHFLPPVSFAPELYILEATPEVRDALAISERGSSQSPPMSRRASPSHRGHSYRNGYNGKIDSDKTQRSFRDTSSPVNKYNPLPHIDTALEPPHRNKSTYSLAHNTNFEPTGPDRHTHDPTESHSARVGESQYRNSPTHHRHKDLAMENQVPWAERAHRPIPVAPEMSDWGEQGQQQQQTARPEVHTALPAAASAAAPGTPQGPWNSQDRHASPDKFGSSRDLHRRPDDDSGVAEMSPDDEYNSSRGRRNHGNHTSRKDDYDMLAKRLESEQLGFGYDEDDPRRRLDDLEGMSRMDRQRWDNDQDDRRRQAEEDRRQEEDERRRREDEEKRRREEEEEKRRREEENRLKEERRRKEEEEELRREEEKLQQAAREEEMNSPDDDPSKRDTESARQRRREEKIQLLRELEEARRSRHEQEKEREELVKKAKALQHKTTNRRNDARDMWKKKYFEEKKRTAPLEENSNRLRQELEALHRRLMNTLEGPKEKNARLVDSNPSLKSNYVIQCTKLQHDIEDLQRRVANAKMKLTAEMKLRSQAQTELKAVRTEAMQNRLTLKLATGQARPARLTGVPPHQADLSARHQAEPHTAAAQ
ncbi:hypothetical protein EGW08_012030 [Elysia chlorotica]|uniref:Spermatogenesis-associated protein 1 C-terminal domain-containing protein n=1 Tax=Elysia chlorotica TaxID=188477 RepID=A0A3S0ZL02_ELYCH|nr:hypothetical protein EGW08_012030 [Elysia chlorotica]